MAGRNMYTNKRVANFKDGQKYVREVRGSLLRCPGCLRDFRSDETYKKHYREEHGQKR